jgi:PKHD-type hydroxylase
MTKTVEWSLTTPSTEENWCYNHNVLTPEGCKFITDRSKDDVYTARVATHGDYESVEDTSIRSSFVTMLDSSDPELEWVFRECTSQVLILNDNFFHLDIEKIESLQYGEYRETVNGHFDRHIDALRFSSGGFRKLSFSIQLSDPSEYEGGDLLLHYGPEGVTAPKEQGTMIMFPSTMLHEVTPVTRGVRRSLVGWVLGPRLK